VSREFQRWDPVRFPHDERPVRPHLEHRDRLQSLSIEASHLADALKRAV